MLVDAQQRNGQTRSLNLIGIKLEKDSESSDIGLLHGIDSKTNVCFWQIAPSNELAGAGQRTPSIDRVSCTGNPGRFFGREKQHKLRDFFGASDATQRMSLLTSF